MPLFDPKSKAISAYQKRIEDNKNAIRSHYNEIGKLYYNQYKDMSLDVTKDINSRCDSVTALYNDIKNCELRILYEKGLKVCKNCGKENNLEYAFCFACGAKFIAEDSKETPNNEETESQEDKTSQPAEQPAESAENTKDSETQENSEVQEISEIQENSDKAQNSDSAASDKVVEANTDNENTADISNSAE